MKTVVIVMLAMMVGCAYGPDGEEQKYVSDKADLEYIFEIVDQAFEESNVSGSEVSTECKEPIQEDLIIRVDALKNRTFRLIGSDYFRQICYRCVPRHSLMDDFCNQENRRADFKKDILSRL